MTNSPLTTRELSNVYTPDSADDAPSVDGNGDPRFVAESEMTNPDYITPEELADFEADYAEWRSEQLYREQYGRFGF